MNQPTLPPVVFIGPSAPPSQVSSILPGALVCPPIQRGDLYRYRILKHSTFVIVDGVFAGRLAVSPREVVDVLGDGAAVLGAASMGALRAADCHPAGAIGIGQIYRLYRCRAISSEDEVAVAYNEERPFPALTVPLVNMRIALRRAARRRLIPIPQASEAIRTAESLPYHERTWRNVFELCGAPAPPALLDFLEASDAKRDDACLALRRVAADLAGDSRFCGLPRARPNVFGLLNDGRERRADPLDGCEAGRIRADFVSWLLLDNGSGCSLLRAAAPPVSSEEFEAGLSDQRYEQIWKAVAASPEFDSLLMRFTVLHRATAEARRLGLCPAARDVEAAMCELLREHAATTWHDLQGRFDNLPGYSEKLRAHLDSLSLAKCLKRILTPHPGASGTRPGESVLWHRT